MLKEERLSLQLKTTVMDHTVKIRILLGPNLQFASKLNYENDIYNKLKYDKHIVEIKKTLFMKKIISLSA